jgi:predicted nucleic acid-binding protein
VIAVDSSALIAYLSGSSSSPAVNATDVALRERQVCLPPVVLSELLSDPKLPARVGALLLELPLLDVIDGYWERAGRLRATVLAARRRARLADTLIAQSCLDHNVPLVALDRDFRHFAAVSDLELI